MQWDTCSGGTLLTVLSLKWYHDPIWYTWQEIVYSNIYEEPDCNGYIDEYGKTKTCRQCTMDIYIYIKH